MEQENEETIFTYTKQHTILSEKKKVQSSKTTHQQETERTLTLE